MHLTLSDVLSIYKYDFYGDSDHEKFVEHVHRHHHKALSKRTKIFITAKQSKHKSAVYNLIKFRYPVYFGSPRQDLYYTNKLKSILGYNESAIRSNLRNSARFSVAGPVMIKPDKLDDRIKEVTIIHTWGVNFESENTQDYINMINKEGSCDLEKYYERQIELFEGIISISEYNMAQNGYQSVNINLPIIGAGCFLKALSNSEKLHCLNTIMSAIESVIYRLPKHVFVKLCVFNPSDYSETIMNRLNVLCKTVNNFSIGTGSVQGNIMNDVPDPIKINKESVVVNAWDPLSFIGNGGNKDISIDGFVVANAGNLNPTFINSSYLHNPFFNEHMTDPSKWVII